MSELRKLTFGYLGLLALLALTVASSTLDLSGFNVALNLVIAVAKAIVIAVIFMHLSGTLPKLAVAAAGLWLALLFGLTLIGR